MCAVPVDGLHKDDVTHEQLVKIQGLLKRRIPTGTTSCLHPQTTPTLLAPPLASACDRKDNDVSVAAGFEAHNQPLKSARMALDEISHELAPSQWLEERSADKKPAQQLGTLGGGNHFLEVLPNTLRALSPVLVLL